MIKTMTMRLILHEVITMMKKTSQSVEQNDEKQDAIATVAAVDS